MKKIYVAIFAFLLCYGFLLSSAKADLGISGLDTNIPEATAGSNYITKITFDFMGAADPTLNFTGLPPGITMDSLIDPYGPVAYYSFYLEGVTQNSGNFNPVLTISNNFGDESTYQFSLTVNGPKYPLITDTPAPINHLPLVAAPTIKPTRETSPAPMTTKQPMQKQVLVVAAPSSIPPTITPIQSSQNLPEISKPDLRPVAHSSMVNLIFDGVANFFKGIGKWFKK